jgi:hypothetical protein
MAVTSPGLTVYGPRTLGGLHSLEHRISAWCEWFGLDELKLKRNRKGQVLLNDDLVAWLYASGTSFDWIVVGDARGMAAAFRKSERDLRQFEDVLKRFDDTEQQLLLDALKASQEDGIPMEEALEDWTKAVEAHRAGKALSEPEHPEP